jgi:hypothetical protein
LLRHWYCVVSAAGAGTRNEFGNGFGFQGISVKDPRALRQRMFRRDVAPFDRKP